MEAACPSSVSSATNLTERKKTNHHHKHMIKILHICWFGNEMPSNIRRNIDSILSRNPGFTLKLHTLDNIDVSKIPFGQKALQEKRWAFLSDIVRIQALIEDGGWYLDTDVELIHPFEKVKGPSNKLLLGYYVDSQFGTSVIYSPPQHPYLKDILESYNNIKPDIWPPNNLVFTDFFVNNVPDFLLNGKDWENAVCKVFPKEYFENASFLRWRGFSIHHFCGSWRVSGSLPMGGNEIRTSYFTLRRNHIRLWRARLKHLRYGRDNNEYYDVYSAALRGEKLLHKASFMS